MAGLGQGLAWVGMDEYAAPRAHKPLRAAALSWKRLPRRMYFRTCLRERWRVWSMMARSEAPPSAAVYGTGQGPTATSPSSGVAAPASPLAETTFKPAVVIGGKVAQVSFSGLAPGFIG